MRIRNLPPVCLTLLLMVASSLRAQQIAEPSGSDATAVATPQSQAPPSAPTPGPVPADAKKNPNPVPPTHRFWDRENDLLFAAVGAGRALDYASTLNLRHRGIDEIFLTNSIVDNHPLFATIEVGATATSIGVSYLFHRTGHHGLERWTSGIHFGVAVIGAGRNYALKTPH
jgi:hypothetical protein